MKGQRHLVLSDGLDRCIENDLRAANFGTLHLEQACDVARRNRAEQLPALACLTEDDVGLAVELAGKRAGLAFKLKALGLQFGLHVLEASFVVRSCTKRFAARQQEIASEAVFDANDIAHLAEFADALEQDYFHSCYSSFLSLLSHVQERVGGLRLANTRSRNPIAVSTSPS